MLSIFIVSHHQDIAIKVRLEIKKSELKSLLKELNGKTDIQKVVYVNNYFNENIQYNSDDLLWGMDDYWATPLETMVKESGDCEDFAIAKYMVLKSAKVNINKMQIAYVISTDNDVGYQQSHMVLKYFDNSKDPFVLDNRNDTLTKLSTHKELTSIYSFNHYSLWVGNNSKRIGTSFNHLSKWKNIIDKMKNEYS